MKLCYFNLPFFLFLFFGYWKNFKVTSPCSNPNSPLTKSRKYQLRQVAQVFIEQLQHDIKNKRGNGQLDKGRCNLLLFGTFILFIGIAMFLPICFSCNAIFRAFNHLIHLFLGHLRGCRLSGSTFVLPFILNIRTHSKKKERKWKVAGMVLKIPILDLKILRS